MSILIKGMDMPNGDNVKIIAILSSGEVFSVYLDNENGELGLCQMSKFPVIAVPVPPHGRLTKRLVYRGEVYNALEEERIKSLDGILTDPYKDGFHDGLKRALQILANDIVDAPTIIPAEED